MVVTRSQTSAATSTIAALKSTCKVNKQPKSSTRSRPVIRTSKISLSSSPSPYILLTQKREKHSF